MFNGIKNNEVKHAILDDLHVVMYMPIEPSENIEAFMNHKKNKIIEKLPNIYSMIHRFNTFIHIIFNSVYDLVLNPLLLFLLCCAYFKLFMHI
jgi:hypothetical protein